MKQSFIRRNWLRLSVTAFIAILLTYFFVLPWLQNQRAKKDIETGDLVYVKEVGWIDMGHAKPDGPRRIVDSIDFHRQGTLTYSQAMKKSFLGMTLVVRKTNRYSIPLFLGKKKNGILRFVFEDVSRDFEKLQAQFPFNTLCGKAIGDINGDRIALLRSLNMEEPECIQNPVDVATALGKFEREDNLTATSLFLKKLLPQPIKVYRYDSKTEYFIE